MPEAQLFCLLSTLFLQKGCYTPQLSLLLTSKDNKGGVKQPFFRKTVDKRRQACILFFGLGPLLSIISMLAIQSIR